jgi:monothiol glutaredoxin
MPVELAAKIRSRAKVGLDALPCERQRAGMPIADPVRARIESLVTTRPIVLFMKGNRQLPQCGFSAQVVRILDELVTSYETVDVLADATIRDGVKEFSSWPTIPQLYVHGQFVGGCDIVKEMYASGELQKLLGIETSSAPPPRVTLSARASAEIENAAGDTETGEKLRIDVSPSFEHELYFDAQKDGDFVVQCGKVAVIVAPTVARRVDGIRIDFTETKTGAGFKIDNPNEPPRVRPLTAKELQARMDAGEPTHLFDVRPEVERKIAKIDRALALDAAGKKRLEELPKDAPVVFQCHHGVRSRAAAEEAIRNGFVRVYNLDGGIDAWSTDVDPTVPRY